MSVKYGLSPSYRKQLGMPSQHSPTGGYLSRGTMFSLRSAQKKIILISPLILSQLGGGLQ